MRTRDVQFALGLASIVGAAAICVAGGEHGWGWLILLAFLCIPGCIA